METLVGALRAKGPPPCAYVNICVVDVDCGQKVGGPTCDITVAQTSLTTPVPTTSEEHVSLDLPPRDCVLSFRFWDSATGQTGACAARERMMG